MRRTSSRSWRLEAERALSGRDRQLSKPLGETPSTRHMRRTGQVPRMLLDEGEGYLGIFARMLMAYGMARPSLNHRGILLPRTRRGI